MSYPGPRHLSYESDCFDPYSFPDMQLAVRCFDKTGGQRDCYQYYVTWRAIESYDAWVIFLQNLANDEGVIVRRQNMFDILNLFLRANPLRLDGTAHLIWHRHNPPSVLCPAALTEFYSLNEPGPDFVDSVSGNTMPRDSLVSVPGLIGPAAAFLDGDASFTDAPLGTIQPKDLARGCSMSCWFSPLDNPAFFDLNVIMSAGLLDMLLTFSGDFSGNFYFNTYSNGPASALTVAAAVGVWYHLCFTYDSVLGTTTSYLNGVPFGSTAGAFNGNLDGPVDLFLSWHSVSGAAAFQQIALFTDGPLTPDEVNFIYNAGAGQPFAAFPPKIFTHG